MMLIKFSKLCYILLIMYIGWFQVVFFQIPRIPLFLGVLMISVIVLRVLQNREYLKKYMTIELVFWMLFAVTSFVFGYIVAKNKTYLIDSIITFIQFLVLIYGIIYISNYDKSIDFFINTYIMYALLCALTAIFYGVEYESGRISMGLRNNPNALGISMVIGICCILYKHSFKKMLYSILSFSGIFVLLYACLLSGSRKAFLSAVLLILYWLIFVVLKDIRLLKFTAKVKVFLSLALAIYAGYYILYSFYVNSRLFERLTILFEHGSKVRENMYIVALKLFKQSPFIGIGLNNYRAVTIFQTYSHSTYAEALACTGIIGSFLYFYPYLIVLERYYGMITNKKIEFYLQKKARVLFGLFLVLVFLGAGVIHFYEMSSTIAFGMLFAFYDVYTEQLKESVAR